MKIGSKIIILGCFVVLFGLLTSLLDGLFPYLIGIPVGIGFIILGVFRNRGYFNKTYYLASFSMVALVGLIMGYVFIFMPYTTDKNELYLYIGLLIFIIVIFSRSYLNRHENPKMPWRDEW